MISVIIPAFNAEKYIRKSLDSVLSQTYREFEIIVVDDGSTDATRDVLRTYCEEIRVLTQKNSGPSAARNAGIREARGKYVAFLDSDDYWAPEKLERQVQAIRDSPDISFINCSVNLIEEDESLRRVNKSSFIQQKLIKELHIWNAVGTPSGWLIARECFNKVGLFDECLKVAEDWDMALRLCRRYKYFVLSEPLLYVVVRKGSQSSQARRNLENELLFLEKIFSDPSRDRSLFLKRKALSYRYRSAAIAFREENNKKEALRSILKSICYYPRIDKKTVAVVVYGLS